MPACPNPTFCTDRGVKNPERPIPQTCPSGLVAFDSGDKSHLSDSDHNASEAIENDLG